MSQVAVLYIHDYVPLEPDAVIMSALVTLRKLAGTFASKQTSHHHSLCSYSQNRYNSHQYKCANNCIVTQIYEEQFCLVSGKRKTDG